MASLQSQVIVKQACPKLGYIFLELSPCLSRSMRFENGGNLGAHAENTHVQIIFVATHSIQFQSHTYWPGYLNNLQR